VRAEDAKEVVVGSAKELKGITAKKITWEKDGAQMALIASGSFEMGIIWKIGVMPNQCIL